MSARRHGLSAPRAATDATGTWATPGIGAAAAGAESRSVAGSRRGRPVPFERALVPLWDILSLDERAALLQVGGLPRDYRPVTDHKPSRRQRLEGIRELDRIMRQRPGRIGQLREDLLLRVEPDEEGQ